MIQVCLILSKIDHVSPEELDLAGSLKRNQSLNDAGNETKAAARLQHPDATDSSTPQQRVKCSWSNRFRKKICTACDVDDDERLGLYLVVRCFAGSSALEGMLMSSPDVTTTCSGKQWQCEPQRLPGWTFTSSPRKRLEVMLPHFDLRKRVLLLNKLLPCNNQLRSVNAMLSDINFFANRREEHPAAISAAGITRILPAFVVMFSPPCVLMKLSTHAKKDPRAFRKISNEFYIAAANFHKNLDKLGVLSVVVNYGDLLWQRAAMVGRLQSRMPCLGHINANYIPKSGLDIFRENKFKTRGSIASYAKYHDPVECGYDVERGKCDDDEFVDDVDAASALTYLWQQSRSSTNASHV